MKASRSDARLWVLDKGDNIDVLDDDEFHDNAFIEVADDPIKAVLLKTLLLALPVVIVLLLLLLLLFVIVVAAAVEVATVIAAVVEE